MKIKLPSSTDSRRFDAFIVIAVVGLLGAGFAAISQGYYEHGDEGFYIVAAQLVGLGKRPYLDFYFQHGPLYPYATAAWFKIFGNSWRSAHLLSALLSFLCAAMMSAFFFRRVEPRGWRLTLAILAPLLLLTNVLTIHWGGLIEPFAWCIAFLFAEFLLTLRAVERPGFSAIWAGLLSGLAASGYLLTAPAAPVLFLWIATHVAKADRIKKCVQFAVGAGIGLLPLAFFLAVAPRITLSNIVGYHFTGRFTAPSRPDQTFIPAVTGWLHSPQGVLLVLLGVVGVAYVFGKFSGKQLVSGPLQLSAVITGFMAIAFCGIRPAPFTHYFILVVPFLTLLACYGVYAIGTRICSGWQPIGLILVVVGIFAYEAKATIREQLSISARQMSWQENEQVAELINRVVPRDCPIFAEDGAIYGAAKRIPPSGLENNYSSFLRAAPETNKMLHVIPQPEIDTMVTEGHFCAVVTWSRERAEALRLGSLYRYHKDYPVHVVFWDWADPLQKR
ncbi:MAG: ArnT family glycosyltransferase [Chthoniobacterales bacterium]